MISAEFLWRNVLVGGKQPNAKNFNFEIREHLLYKISEYAFIQHNEQSLRIFVFDLGL